MLSIIPGRQPPKPQEAIASAETDETHGPGSPEGPGPAGPPGNDPRRREVSDAAQPGHGRHSQASPGAPAETEPPGEAADEAPWEDPHGEPFGDEPPWEELTPAPAAPSDGFAGRFAARHPWSLLEVVVLIAITALGAALRFVRLSHPHGYVFDEIYYAKDACLYLNRGMAFCKSPGTTEQSYVHPELGKWIIAIGEAIWGYNDFGWRVMPAVFGTAMIPVSYLLGRNLFGRWAAAMTAFFVATDFLLLVQSRVAMLDILLTFFVVLGFLFVVCEHRRVLRLREAGAGRLDIRWRLAIGFALGAATATKWSGLFALAGAGLLVLIWTIGTALKLRERARAAGVAPRAPSPNVELNATLLSIGLPVIAVYLACYAAWFKDHGYSVSAFFSLQKSMYLFNVHLHATHPYASRPWSWPIIERPVAYYFTSVAGTYHHVLAFGNPLTWYAALLAFVYLAIRAFRGRHGPERFVLVAWLFQYLPWFKFSRTSFFYYMTPIVPFMMLGLAGSLTRLGRGSRWRTGLVVAYLIAVGGSLWFWYPVIAGTPLSVAHWHWRMLFASWI